MSKVLHFACHFFAFCVSSNTISTIGCGIAEFTGISSSSVLSAPTGLMSSFSTTVDSNYNPYLAPWLYASMGSQSIAKDDADAAEKDITFPKLPNTPKIYYLSLIHI